MLAKVIWAETATNAMMRSTVLFCDVQPHHYVEAYYCARHRLLLEPLRGPEPNPAADREEGDGP
jgi:hypothetical protein